MSEIVPEFYYPFIIVFVLIFSIVQMIIFFIKNTKLENNISTEEIAAKSNRLKWIYLFAFLTAKGAMWAKAPYTFLLFSTYHKIDMSEIGKLYIVDAIFSLVFGPFLGLAADTFGRKKISLLYPINMIILISLRMTGNISLAYLGQCLSGISSGVLSTSYEAWLNYEINMLFSDSKDQKENFKKYIFSKVMFYDSILSLSTTIIGAIIYVNIYI
jgi:hypothetical protein